MEKENIDPKLVLALMEREICRRALLMHLLMLGYAFRLDRYAQAIDEDPEIHLRGG